MNEKDITITEDQLWSYIACPVHYDLVQKGIISEAPHTLTNFINQVARGFFSNLMDGVVISEDSLKQQWDEVWRANTDYIDDKKGIHGYACLIKMYRWAANVRLRILDVAVPYNILFQGREEQLIAVKGIIPVIAVTSNMKPEILVMDYGDKHTNQVRTDMNLRYTLQCLGFKQQSRALIGIHVRNLKHDTDTYSVRTQEDYLRLERTVTDVSWCIRNKLFYPREGLNCLSCDTAGACRFWH